MERYNILFNKLSIRNEVAFVPFFVLGDPNPELFLNIINIAIESGADALELGIPFSDPSADGSIIQNAILRSFSSGITFEHCFKILKSIRYNHPNIPIGLLVYANIVFCNGINVFYDLCHKIGIDSVLIADLPIEESKPFYDVATYYNVAPVFICPPNADDKLLYQIAKLSKGYIYLLSRSGVTGSDNRNIISLSHIVNNLVMYHSAPILLGFGISESLQICNSHKLKINGFISGSAIAQIIEIYLNKPSLMIDKIAFFIKNMKFSTTQYNIN